MIRIEDFRKDFNKPRWELKAKSQRYPPKRWGHTASLYQKHLYIFGGKTVKTRQFLFKINCQTYECEFIEFINMPQNRQSHSCSIIGSFLYIWGGCQKKNVLALNSSTKVLLDDFIQFNIVEKDRNWKEVAQVPKISARESHASTVVDACKILIYGGFDQSENLVNEFWLFNTEDNTWKPVALRGDEFVAKVGCSMTVAKEKIYIFGGENQQQEYSNDLFRLELLPEALDPEQPLCIIVSKVEIIGKRPQPRSSHACVLYKQRYLMVIGGEGEYSGKATLLSDVWYYDLNNKNWFDLEIGCSHIFRPRSNFSANVYKNRIIIFGGLVAFDNFRSSDELFVLTLAEEDTLNLSVCNLCKFNFQEASSNTQKTLQRANYEAYNHFQMGLTSLFKVGSLIKNPFDAIGMVVNCFELLSFQQCHIKLANSLKFQFNEGHLQVYQVERICRYYQYVDPLPDVDQRTQNAISLELRNKSIDYLSYNLKNCCARLGNAFLFSFFQNDTLHLQLTTSFGIHRIVISPTLLNPPQAKRQEQIILDYLRQSRTTLDDLRQCTFCVVISSLRPVSNGKQQIYVNELGNVQCRFYDFQPFASLKRSLWAFLSNYFLEKPKINVRINGQPIIFQSPKNDCSLIELQGVNQKRYRKIGLKIESCPNFINYYFKGRYIGSYFSKKYATKGYVQFNSHLEINLSQTKIQGIQYFEMQLIKLLANFSKQVRRRSGNGEETKGSKRINSN